jgi:hypothetical protein
LVLIHSAIRTALACLFKLRRISGLWSGWSIGFTSRCVSAQGVRTEVCCQVIDALRIAARYQCTRDLFEELICAKVSPLWAGQRWFAVTEDKYKDKGLKCSDIDVEAKWKNVLEKAESWKQGLRGSWPLLLNPWRSLSVGSGLMRSGASGLPFLIV